MSPTGVFTAGGAPGQTVITVVDKKGTQGQVTITVNPALGLVPINRTVVSNNTSQFTASGGVPPYTYLTSGSGRVNPSGLYAASSTSGSDTVKVIDSLGNSSQVGITVITPKKVAISYLHGCAVLSDGSVQCWGNNRHGELGSNQVAVAVTPIAVPGITSAIDISVGYTHSCALLADGTIECWGDNSVGQVGNGTISSTGVFSPVQVTGINSATAISTDGSTNCAIVSGGAVKCWGNNAFGQLGNNSTTYSAVPVSAGSIANAVSISGGCAVLSSGSIVCWGDNGVGEFGNNTTTSSLTPVAAASGITTAVSVSGGTGQTCAVLANHTVMCWGFNLTGQLGNGTTTNSLTPVPVSGITTAVAVSTHSYITCARLSDGGVQCWGAGYNGSLGNGMYADSAVPVTVTGMSTATDLSVGEYSVCAVSSLGKMQCWGNNEYNTLGSASVFNGVPAVVQGISRATSISGGGFGACALLSNKTVNCWGTNRTGELGNGTTSFDSVPVPTAVTGISNAIQISSGSGPGYQEHRCALLDDGTIQCWGWNNFGQLGNGTNTNSAIPVTVSGINTATQISAGNQQTCAIKSDHTAWCWGKNLYGQLGNSSNIPSNVPIQVPGITTAISVTVGQTNSDGVGYACALLSGGTVDCWGNNWYNNLGNPAQDGNDTLPPTPVSGLTNAIAVYAADYYTCAIKSDHTAYCWGEDDNGDFGDGTLNSSDTPVQMTTVDAAQSLSLGFSDSSWYHHTCAVGFDGIVRCWGSDYDGQLGDNANTDSLSAVVVPGLSNITQMTSGIYFSCALSANGTVSCWGYNGSSQLANPNVGVTYNGFPVVAGPWTQF